jgi:RND family efflux transporter MFP subunit
MTVSKKDILPGLAGRATIYLSTEAEKLTIPQPSVYSDGLQPYVFVEEASTHAAGEYRKQNVRLGNRKLSSADPSVPMIEMLQGDIYPGDRVVVKGGHELSSLFFLGVLKLSDADQQRLGIVTTPATYRSIAQVVELPASITLPPENRSVVSSQLDGTIHSHTLSPGREVRAGEVLMEIASPDFYTMQLDLLKSSMDAALSRRRAERLDEVRGDAVSARLALETRSQAEQLEARAQSLRRQLTALGLLANEIESIVTDRTILDFLPLRSTIDGKIASSATTLGETVIANQPLVEIHNLRSLWIEAHLPAAHLASMPQAAKGIASVLANTDIRIPVAVSRIGPIVEESTRTQRVWLSPESTASLPNLRAGTLMSVSISLGNPENKLAIPSSAILRDGLHFFTFVKRRSDYIDRRRVTIGRTDGEFVEIVQGVDAGESVVSRGGRELQTAFASLR